MATKTGAEYHHQVRVAFPSGEDSVVLRQTHMWRMRNQSSSLPVDEALKVCGLAHSVQVGKGQRRPDSVELTYYMEGSNATGGFALTEVCKTRVSSPGKPLALAFVRSLAVKAWPLKGGDWHKEDFYVLSYDASGFTLTSPRLESIYLPRDALDMPPPLHQTPNGFKRPNAPPPGVFKRPFHQA